MAETTYGVMVQEQGKPLTVALVGNGATVRTALKAVRKDPDTLKGEFTLNGKKAELGDRISKNDLIAIVPSVAGGR